MDGTRFDQLARALARGASRRGVLKSLVAAIAGGALATAAADPGEAATCRQDGGICRKNGDCCSHLCLPPDRTGRQYCGCASPADCPAPPVCKAATCTGHSCGTAADPTKNGQVCGSPATCNPSTNSARTADRCQDGSCIPGVTTSCGLYVCSGTVCATSCASDGDCVPSAHCDDDNVCRADHGLGIACEGAGDCVSGHCVNGVCCDSACTDPCYRCDGAVKGTCAPNTGLACSGGTCVDGSCCPAAQVCGSGASALCGCNGDTCCSGICTELGTVTNCSGCSDACGGGQDCCGGACTTLGTVAHCQGCGDVCTGTTPACCAGSGCADLDANTIHCGSCSTSCTGLGFGSPACCGGGCADLLNDATHCGTCGTSCTGTDPACCGGSCDDLDSSTANCGACGSVCDTSKVDHSTAVTCSGGRCLATACDAQTTLINGSCCLNANVCGVGQSATCCQFSETCCSGVCVDLSIDKNNCGSCGTVCPGEAACTGRVCSAGSFGEACSAQVPCSFYLVNENDTCLNGHCCIPSGVACVKDAITFSGQCCSNTNLSCPSVGTCP